MEWWIWLGLAFWGFAALVFWAMSRGGSDRGPTTINTETGEWSGRHIPTLYPDREPDYEDGEEERWK